MTRHLMVCPTRAQTIYLLALVIDSPIEYSNLLSKYNIHVVDNETLNSRRLPIGNVID